MSDLKNPLLAEIRRIRLEMDAECQHDPQLFYEYICKLEEKYKNRLFRRVVCRGDSIPATILEPNR